MEFYHYYFCSPNNRNLLLLYHQRFFSHSSFKFNYALIYNMRIQSKIPSRLPNSYFIPIITNPSRQTMIQANMYMYTLIMKSVYCVSSFSADLITILHAQIFQKVFSFPSHKITKHNPFNSLVQALHAHEAVKKLISTDFFLRRIQPLIF